MKKQVLEEDVKPEEMNSEEAKPQEVKQEEDHQSADFQQYLTFLLGNDVYGVDVKYVKEVNEYEQVFVIPTVPDYIRGVMNLRGEVVPVLDLSYRLYNRASVISKLSCIVIVEIFDGDETKPIGVVIDAIKSVADINQDSIEETPSFGSKIRPEFINGVGKVNDVFVILLNIDKVVDIEELSDFNQSQE